MGDDSYPKLDVHTRLKQSKDRKRGKTGFSLATMEPAAVFGSESYDYPVQGQIGCKVRLDSVSNDDQ